MKKIVFYIIEKSQDKPNVIFSKKNKNSLLKFQENKFYFNSLYEGEPEEIEVNFDVVNFDKILFQKLSTIKKTAIDESNKISSEEIGFEKTKGSLDSIIYSEILKSSHENPKSIFHFVGSIFLKILMGHKLTNGNKRVALLFLIGSLRYFGYHFNWSKGIHQDYSKYKTEVEKFVEILQNINRSSLEKNALINNIERRYNKNIDSISKEEIEEYIFEWIDSNCTIALEWR